MQVVSALHGGAASLTHFVRSPQWVLWAPMWLPQPSGVATARRSVPGLHDRVFQTLQWGSQILADVVTTPSWRRRAVQAYARLSLQLGVRDAALRARLTPDDEPLCKRQVVSGSYYRAVQSSNTRLETAAIEKVVPDGIVTVDGRLHRLDVIVLATGFRTHDYMRPMAITGRDGRTLDQE